MQSRCTEPHVLCLFLLKLLLASEGLYASEAPQLVHHDLRVQLSADDATLAVTDRVTLPQRGPGAWPFTLRATSEPVLSSPGATLELLATGAGQVARYRVILADGVNAFSLAYRVPVDVQPGRSLDSVFLSGTEQWYPVFDETLLRFDLNMQLPDGWLGVSQGRRVLAYGQAGLRREHWHSATPQEQIYLLAGPFIEYSDRRGDLEVMAYLRRPDQVLARQYLAAAHHYVTLYEELLGDYPYKKFALVENVRETGYGMPSFTLLGSRVIRLPFILHSSYPHEILHNWWGNGVYPDYASGNWAEGLTTYLADHLIREQQGQGPAYRRDILQKYADYVDEQDDFPLRDFRGRLNAPTEAVGYGKTLMVFHMLRRSLGDAAFLQGLRRFYQDNLFSKAGFADLQDAFSAAAGESLAPFFRQWVHRPGAPQLQISEVGSAREDTGFHLSFTLEQAQSGDPYALQLPLAITLEGHAEAWQTTVPLARSSQQVRLTTPARPLHVEVDPDFDLFRRLHPAETPPSISQALGARKLLVVLPDSAPPALQNAYRSLAETWSGAASASVDIVTDAQISQLPLDRGVLLLGCQNAWRDALADRLSNYEYSEQPGAVTLAGHSLLSNRNAVVVMTRPAEAQSHALGWLAAPSPAAAVALARKLHHYGRYSYLAFEGEGMDNILRGQWPVLDSPLSVRVIQADGSVPEYQRATAAPAPPLLAAPAVAPH